MGDENLSGKSQDEEVSLDLNCDKKEIVEELRICLPKWVTQQQVSDMIRGGTWRDIVEIVDNFYEYETKFYEQVSTLISFTSRYGISLGNGEELLSKLEKLHCETERNESQPLQFHKLQSLSNSQKSRISPVKRKGKIKGKPKKKGKACSKVESVGPKQASITKFFNKVP